MMASQLQTGLVVAALGLLSPASARIGVSNQLNQRSLQEDTLGLPILRLVGNNGSPESAFPLGECQGDCDNDLECEQGLVCLQRNSAELLVPGCDGDVMTEADYCVQKENANEETMVPTLQASVKGSSTFTEAPTLTASFDASAVSTIDDNDEFSSTAQPTAIFTAPIFPLATVGNDGNFPAYPLSICEGDCDTDADCIDEMVCFQRDEDEPVPGCEGVGDFSIDYCVGPNQTVDATASIQLALEGNSR